MTPGKTLIYVLRHDLRATDNPVLHRLASYSDHGFAQLLPLYIFPAHQVEASGFLLDGHKSPYPEARGRVSGFWRCGPHRAKFLAESVWDMRESLKQLGSGLALRVGRYEDVLGALIEGLRTRGCQVGAVWMLNEEGVEERGDQDAIASVCETAGVDFRILPAEQHYVDDRDLKLETPDDLPDIFTTYRKLNEELRDRPRDPYPKPPRSSLPRYPAESDLPEQAAPFQIPQSREDLIRALVKPVEQFLDSQPEFPQGAASAHALVGGETHALERLDYIIKSGVVCRYKNSRNGLLGMDFSTKLSAYLAMGCITARQIHRELVAYEDGHKELYSGAEGYGKGENEGSKGIRVELLWRDYMRLCARKFSHRLFRATGFRDEYAVKWKVPKASEAGEGQTEPTDDVAKTLQRFFQGTTGMGLIDASQRELIHTGYTSNRARQNVASFLAKHLGIDWRFGAEFYEMLLIDYDVSSNWANWQYVAGVGNDPRGEARIFNPVKQAFEYDKDGEYVRCWVPELRQLEKLENVFQAWTTPKEEWDRFGLTGLLLAEDPIKKIDFSVDGKFKGNKRPFDRRRRDGRSRGAGSISGNGNASGSGNDSASGPPRSSNESRQTSSDAAPAPRTGSRAGHQQPLPRDTPRSPRNFRGGGGFRGGRGSFGGGSGSGVGGGPGSGGGGGGEAFRGRDGYGPPRGLYRGGYMQHQPIFILNQPPLPPQLQLPTHQQHWSPYPPGP